MIELAQVDETIPILPDTDPLLRTISKPVEAFDSDLHYLAERMAAAMLARGGVGLAAVQIGTPVRLILIREGDRLIFMANPVITRRLNRDDLDMEGCLSVERANWRRIARPAKCEVEWQDLDGNPQAEGFSGQPARAVQHEVEHLDGKLIIDYPKGL